MNGAQQVAASPGSTTSTTVAAPPSATSSTPSNAAQSLSPQQKCELVLVSAADVADGCCMIIVVETELVPLALLVGSPEVSRRLLFNNNIPNGTFMYHSPSGSEAHL